MGKNGRSAEFGEVEVLANREDSDILIPLIDWNGSDLIRLCPFGKKSTLRGVCMGQVHGQQLVADAHHASRRHAARIGNHQKIEAERFTDFPQLVVDGPPGIPVRRIRR